jgi:glycosyltransferase involved in cell wall biosynthesis
MIAVWRLRNDPALMPAGSSPPGPMLTNSSAERPRRVAFVMEQTLGHVAYTRDLQRALEHDSNLQVDWIDVPYSGGSFDGRPFVRAFPWAVRGSIGAVTAVRARGRPSRYDALFLHTQSIALAAPFAFRGVPVVISLDATPLNFDTVGASYAHEARPGSFAERLKLRWYRRTFRSASALTTWCHWAKDSLEADYGVDAARISVVAPGVDINLFRPGNRSESTEGRPVKVLFVGGDFIRKGGRILLKAMTGRLRGLCELHIVTQARVAEAPGIAVYHDIGPNDPRLVRLYREADIFALPTLADCRAMVLSEAMASGLPIVTTSVGAQPEVVRDGVTGFIVPPCDVEAFSGALMRLIEDGGLRRAMGRRAREVAEVELDAGKNAGRLIDIVQRAIDGWHSCHTERILGRKEPSTS